MRALLLSEYMHLELADLAVPAIGPRDVLIRVRACGICGSDVHGLDGSTGRRIPPLVMGHEAAGVIDAVGSAVDEWKPGDRVTFDSTISCGECFFCRQGEINLCDRREVLGVSCGDYRRNGAFAEYVAVPARILYRLPEALSFDQAAVIEAVSVAVHGVSLAPMNAGDTALEAGADLTFDSRGADVPAEVRERTNGRGADVVFEAVGSTAPIQTAISAVRKGGTVTLIGNVSPRIELPLQQVVSRQIRLQGSCASSGEYPTCIDLMARGAIRVDNLISARTPLEGAAEWFGRLYRHEPNLMKVIVEP
jgi:L-iditol 2-dehydrogenase